MWHRNVVVLLLFCSLSPSIVRGRVYFISKNFYNVLHWDPVKPAFPGQKVLYSVQYWRGDDQHYLIKDECQNITRLSCDLTAETPSVYDVYYRAKVMVNGSCHDITTSFKPLRDTVLGPPLLSIRTTASTLHVNITVPNGPNEVSITDIINTTKKAVVEYTLKITYPQWAAQVVKSKNNHFDINLKYNQSKYCGHLVYTATPEWGRSVSENASFCVTLPDDPHIPFLWPLLGAAVLAGIVIVSAVCVCNYVKGGDSKIMTIKSLVMPFQKLKIMEHPDKNLRISEVSINDGNQIVHNKEKTPPTSVKNSAYRQQKPDISAQSSGSYAAVVVQPQDEENERNFQPPDTMHRCSSLLPFTESSEEEPQIGGGIASWSNPEQQPLVLQTVIDINGQLQLSFPLMGNPGELQMNTERKLLLSDVTCQDGPFNSFERVDSLDGRDSGCYDSLVNTPTSLYCNTSYSSETTVPDFQQECQTTLHGDAIFQSGYKQNWMPERPHEPINIHRHLDLY
ncbi:interferon lambda receptor 1 isoform X2 [Poeciliopsis prolifica]|uniref:interferon lambda receptor 1 isoform X2 n=1 Tax=Poeciliopsis prolifica TaxID=188132 RepID=UPI002413B1CB|nr:interferon lambda receptor 1 isoform X2 [Poeciliopsis prolifica]